MNEQQKQQSVKVTGGVEGGTKSHLMVVMPPNAPAPAVTPGGVPGPGADAAGVAGTVRPRLSNESNDVSLDLSQIHEHLAALTGGRLKSVAGALCYPRTDEKTGRDKPEYLRDAPSLFAWIDGYAHVDWCKKRGCYTKEEFLRHLEDKCPRYAWATDLPHCPPLTDIFYTSEPPAPAATGRLDAFVALFDLCEEADRALVKAFVMTPFWGGPPGKRPLFVFAAPADGADPDAGRGAGKSTAAQAVAKVAGGALSLRRTSDADRVLSDLVSPAGLAARVVLLDNVKSLKLSSEFLESLITADAVDGHRLYAGHAQRPNVLTYVLTANEPMLSKDLATRSVPVFVKQAKKSPEWDAKLHALLNDAHFLEELYADILWHFQQPTRGGDADEAEGGFAYDRWALWWHEVASRVCQNDDEFRTLLAAVQTRRGVLDGDVSEAEAIEEALASVMIASNINDPELFAVFFPTRVLRAILADVFGRNASTVEVGRRLKAMQLPKLRYTKVGPPGNQHGYWWVGSKAGPHLARGMTFTFREDAPGRGFVCESVPVPPLVMPPAAAVSPPPPEQPPGGDLEK